MEFNMLFRPVPATTVNLSASNVSSRVEFLPTATINATDNLLTVRVYNSGTVVVFINFGGSSVTATTTTSMPMPPGWSEPFRVHPSETYCAGITASGTSTVYFTVGEGM